MQAAPQAPHRSVMLDEVASCLALLGPVRAKGVALPDLEAVPQADKRHPVGQAKGVAQGFGQGDAAGGVEGQFVHAAIDDRLERQAQRIAQGQIVDHGLVLIEHGLAAAFDAVGLDGRETEDAAKWGGGQGAEILRHDDAPFTVQLFLEGREKHPAKPQSRTGPPHALPSLRAGKDRRLSAEAARSVWVNMG